MIGIGSRPVSAMRPANTETYAAAPGARHSITSSTCATVMSAVTLTFTPSATSRRRSGPMNSPPVLVTGIFT